MLQWWIVCMYVCMYVCVHACLYICACVSVRVCQCEYGACMFVQTCVGFNKI